MLSSVRGVFHVCLGMVLIALALGVLPVFAQEPAVAKGRTITGTVQNQDLIAVNMPLSRSGPSRPLR